MKYLVVLGLLLVGCSKPTPHRFAVGDCYFDGGYVFTIKEIGKYGYAVTSGTTTHTYGLSFTGEQLVEQVDCKFVKENRHGRN